MSLDLLEPGGDRKVFSRDFTPGADDIDENGHVNNVVYLRWVQETAISHWDSLCPSDEQAKWAWIVLRHEVDYRRPLLPGETATSRTWVADAPDGPRFERFVRIDGPDGAMCAQARTIWCLIALPSRRPKRVPAWMVEMFA